MRAAGALVALLIPLLLFASSAGATEVTYTIPITEATYMDAAYPTAADGSNNVLYVGDYDAGAGGEIMRALLRIPAASIRTDYPPTQFDLVLTNMLASVAIGASNYIGAYRMQPAFVEARATWNVYATGQSWAKVGCDSTVANFADGAVYADSADVLPLGADRCFWPVGMFAAVDDTLNQGEEIRINLLPLAMAKYLGLDSTGDILILLKFYNESALSGAFIRLASDDSAGDSLRPHVAAAVDSTNSAAASIVTKRYGRTIDPGYRRVAQ